MSRVDRSVETLEVKTFWWVFLLLGVLSLAAGVILIAQPSHSLATLAVVTGIFVLIDGIVELVSSLGRNVENRGLAAIVGVLGIVVGIVLIRHPFGGVSAIGIVIGIWLVAAGVVRMLHAVAGPRPLLSSLIALVEIVAGIAVVSNPHIGYTTLAILLGIWLIINGIGTVAFGLLLRGAESTLRRASSA